MRNVTAAESTFLEVCIENASKNSLYLEYVKFDPSAHWNSQPVNTWSDHDGKWDEDNKSQDSGGDPLNEAQEVLASIQRNLHIVKVCSQPTYCRIFVRFLDADS